jgi:hypothetical protein
MLIQYCPRSIVLVGLCGLRVDRGRCLCSAWQHFERCGNISFVANNRNLADPDFEPSDEDLIGLSQRAFAHVRKAHEESMVKLRADIAAAREVAMKRLHDRKKRTEVGS